jgi:hypothetical protein
MVLTILIRGNHDFRQDDNTYLDLICPFVDDLRNTHYLDHTGYHRLHNLGIGLVAIQDTLLPNASSGSVKALPPFPQPDIGDDATYKLALFHGMVPGSKLQNGAQVGPSKISLGWIKGYDAVLLGDIHLQQLGNVEPIPLPPSDQSFSYATPTEMYRFTDKAGAAPWGYPGSLTQQNFGEPLMSHGFIEWDLAARTATCFHVPNDYGRVTLQPSIVAAPQQAGTDMLESINHALFRIMVTLDQEMPLAVALQQPWFPKNIHLRYPKALEIRREVLLEMLLSNDRTVLSEQVIPADLQQSDLASHSVAYDGTLRLSDPSVWEKHLLDQMEPFDIDWRSMLHRPERLLLPQDQLPVELKSQVTERNAKINKKIDLYGESLALSTSSKRICLHHLSWKNILCFGANNWFV